jgi:uncharacterized membrane protein YqjE
MATTLTRNSEPSLASLVSGIVSDAQALIKQEMALARRELADELNKAKQATLSLGVGAAVAGLGGVLLALMVVYILHEEAGMKLWLSYLIVGGVLAIAGATLLLFARAKASEISLVPKQTVETLRENVQWIKDQT